MLFGAVSTGWLSGQRAGDNCGATCCFCSWARPKLKKKFFLPKVLIRIILDTHFGGGKDIRQISVSFFSFTIFEKQLPILF